MQPQISLHDGILIVSLDSYHNGGGSSQSYQYMSATKSKREPICKVCEQDLYDDELDFYPCNCKYQLCYECYNVQLEIKDQKCPNCLKYYEVHRVNEYIKKSSSRQVKNISSTQETYSSSNMSSYSMKHGSQNNQTASKQLMHSYKSPSQFNSSSHHIPKRTSSDNNRQNHIQQQQQMITTTTANATTNIQNIPIAKLSQIRILQKHILYVIGLSPSIAKEETLRRYEYFGQYGRIQQITINKENVYQSDNQGICFAAYITYSQPQEASIAILAVDQFVYDSRLIRASFGRTKYCKFFLKETQCPKKECPYQHTLCDQNEALTQDDMQKRQLFQQCQSLAFQLSKVCLLTEDQFRHSVKMYKDTYYTNQQLKSIMPSPESIYEKKSLFKQFAQYMKQAMSHQQLQQQQQQQQQQPTSCRSVNIRQPSSSHQSQQSQPSQKQVEDLSDKIQPSQQIYKSSMSTSSQSFQIKNRNPIITMQNELQQTQSQKIVLEEIKADQPLNSDNLAAINKDEIIQKQVKRNNSTDESRNNTSQTRIENFQKQIVLSLTKQLESEQDSKNLNSIHNEDMSIFNEKRTSRFLNMRDSSDEEDRIPQRENIILSRRSSLGQGYKKGSMQSLIVESLKFLIDDTDVVPKREPLIQKNHQFDTQPPSEVFNVATPAQSNLGGFNDEDIMWNNTIFSHNEYHHNTRNTNHLLEDKSYYSHQGFNNNQQRFSQTYKDNGGNSLFTNNSFLNQNFQPMRSSQAFNDSNFQNSFSAHKPPNGQSFFGNIGVGPFGQYHQGNSNMNLVGRKTTLAQDQIESQITGESKSLQLNRSPSQPNYEKLCLSQQANSRNQNMNPFNHIQISQFTTQQMYGGGTADAQYQMKRSLPNQASVSVANINNSNKQYQLNKQNLDLLDMHYETSKDLMYAKIFCQDGAASMNNNFICSQSLFYYNSQLDDDNEGADMSNKRFSKLSERGQVPRTPVKDSRGLFRLTDDDDFYHDDSQFDQITKNSEPKNYYKEFLSLKDSSIFSGNLFNKRRNSLEQDREKLHPQSLQFNNNLSPFINDSQTDNGGALGVQGQIKKKSKSRSRQRKTTAMTSNIEHGRE